MPKLAGSGRNLAEKCVSVKSCQYVVGLEIPYRKILVLRVGLEILCFIKKVPKVEKFDEKFSTFGTFSMFWAFLGSKWWNRN